MRRVQPRRQSTRKREGKRSYKSFFGFVERSVLINKKNNTRTLPADPKPIVETITNERVIHFLQIHISENNSVMVKSTITNFAVLQIFQKHVYTFYDRITVQKIQTLEVVIPQTCLSLSCSVFQCIIFAIRDILDVFLHNDFRISDYQEVYFKKRLPYCTLVQGTRNEP